MLIIKFIRSVFPMVNHELKLWQAKAASIPDKQLAEQALASIRTKSFHCQGGSFWALYPGVDQRDMVEFIVAYQTISDYLDNLVDTLGEPDELAFAQLHLAMQEALDPSASLSDFYRYFPYQNDGGYLNNLVKSCQSHLAALPSLHLVKRELKLFAQRYSELQTLKHLAPQVRESRLEQWSSGYLKEYPELTTWEFDAATGSTLGIFALVAASYNPLQQHSTSQSLIQAYFPWICALHILLDYLVDLPEDKETNQLNFVNYYPDQDFLLRRFEYILSHSLQQAAKLPYPVFHRTLIFGLLAMYLSIDTCSLPMINATSVRLLKIAGLRAKGLHLLYKYAVKPAFSTFYQQA